MQGEVRWRAVKIVTLHVMERDKKDVNIEVRQDIENSRNNIIS